MNFSEQLKYLRVQLRCTQVELAKKLGMSPGAIHKYENGQMQPTLRSIKKYEDYIKNNKINLGLEKETSKEGRLNMDQQNKLIDYQEKEILQLKEENKLLKANPNMTIDSLTETNYQYSMKCKFEIDVFKASVKMEYIEATSSFNYIVKRLGYSKNTLINKIFCFGQSINYSDHPIHLLRSKEAKKEMLKVASNILKSMLLSKGAMYAYNLKVPVTYQTKDGLPVHAMNQYLVDWVSKTAVANIFFHNGVD